MTENRLTGLIAATFTPMHRDGSLNLDAVPRLVDHCRHKHLAGMYVLGSTGEGVSLTGEERRATAEAFVQAADGTIPVIIQVGHNSLREARQLAAHSQQIGAAAISATPPVYFKPDSVDTLVACMAEIAAGAPATPFYYYHTPQTTGVNFKMVEFLRLADKRLPTLAGIKFTDASLHEAQACLELNDGQFDIFHGKDEMLLAGLAIGLRGAVGSTYNFATPLYHQMIRAFSRDDIDEAQLWSRRSIEMIDIILQYPGLASQKAIMTMIGLDCGPPRLPVPSLTEQKIIEIRDKLTAIGFFDWIAPATPSDEDAHPHPLRWYPRRHDRAHGDLMV